MSGRFSLLDFYERRIRRIVPALAATLIATSLAFHVLLPADEMSDLSRSIIASILSVSNLFFWKTSGYFDPSAETRPLLHTWSLSLEEQFYLLIPVLMLMVGSKSSRFAKFLLFGAGVSSFALSVFMMQRAPSANFFLLPTRAWELLIGSLLALHPIRLVDRPLVHHAISGIGLSLIAIALFTYGKDTAFPGLSAALPTVGAALLITCGSRRDTLASHVLSSAPLVAIGAISYSLYLVHWPVITFARYMLLQDPGPIAVVVICGASFALAALSWRFIERPFRRPKNSLRRPVLFAGTAGLILMISLIGYLGIANGGMESEPTRVDGGGQQVTWERGICFLLNAPGANWSASQCKRTTGAPKNALLWGDSFAAHYVPGLVRNAERLEANIIQYTSAGCPPVLSYRSYALPYCHDFNQAIFDVIKANDIKIVILSARWDLLRGRSLDGLRSTIDRLTEGGAEVYVIGLSPIFSFNPGYLAHRKAGVSSAGEASWTVNSDVWQNEAVRAHVGKATFIDPLAHLCVGSECAYMHEGTLLYSDYGHFSDFGSDLAVRLYFPLLRRRGGI